MERRSEMTPVDGAGDRENQMQAVDHDRKRREDEAPQDAAFEPGDASGVSIEAAIDRAEPVESIEATLPASDVAGHGHFGEPKILTKRTLAEILVALAEDTSRQRVSVADLLTAMQDRAFGALMLIFAMPNALPTPPGTSAILGAPLVFLAAQLMFGMKPWLPKIIANRSMARGDFATMIGKAAPWIAWAEKLLKPRLVVLARPPAEYVIGAVCLLMATILFLPIPLGNMLPALAICLFSFGLLERDGVWVLAGLVTSVVASILVSGVVFALIKGGLYIFAQTFG